MPAIALARLVVGEVVRTEPMPRLVGELVAARVVAEAEPVDQGMAVLAQEDPPAGEPEALEGAPVGIRGVVPEAMDRHPGRVERAVAAPEVVAANAAELASERWERRRRVRLAAEQLVQVELALLVHGPSQRSVVGLQTPARDRRSVERAEDIAVRGGVQESGVSPAFSPVSTRKPTSRPGA